MADADRLRADIDSGKTRDKVPFPDPAAAPLGTDAEASGAPAAEFVVGDEKNVPPLHDGGPAANELGRPYDEKGAIVPGGSFPTAVVVILGAILVLAATIAFAFQ